MTDLVAAAELVDEDVVAYPLRRDRLVAAGPDAASYLQGQLSQEVEGLEVGATARTLLLQPQGKVDGWFRMHRLTEDEFWLDTDAGHGEASLARLERFKLRVDLELRVETVTMLALRGPRSAEAAEQVADVSALPASWGEVEGVDLIDPKDALDHELMASVLGVALGPREMAEVVRVRQALPAMGSELDESTIPAAAGVVEVSVDFNKGCYVGQELVARVDSRGSNTPSKLHRFRTIAEAPPAAGTALLLDGEAVGQVTSAIAWPGTDQVFGLAYCRRAVNPPVTLFTADSDNTQVEVDPLVGLDQ